MTYIEILNTFILIVIAYILLKPSDAKKQTTLENNQTGQLIMDSSGLIDGRILELANSGFISSTINVPQFILSELQLLADGNDSHKRERARFGLDVISELQKNSRVKVFIDRHTFDSVRATDDKLIALAKQIKGVIYTTDFNLSKVALVEGVLTMNVNELSHKLRPITLPGESISVKIIQKGSSPGQGVGYLDDGTMIVVDGAIKYIGKKVEVKVDRMHQTVAGKMVFGKKIS